MGADFYKVPRATVVRILSAVRESILVGRLGQQGQD